MVVRLPFLRSRAALAKASSVVPLPTSATRRPASSRARISAIAPPLVRHRIASGLSTVSMPLSIEAEPVMRIGASAMASHRLASVASPAPNRKEWDNARWVPSAPVITSRAPRQP